MGFASVLWAQDPIPCTTNPFDPRPLPLCDPFGGGGGNSADFSLSASPATTVVAPNASASYQVTVQAINNFSSPVQLSASGFNATFSPNPTTGSSTMTLTNGTALGTFQVTVTGTGGGLTRTTNVVLISSNPPTATRFVPLMTPCRVVDTRNANGTFGGPFLSGGASREFDIPSSSCNIPSTAQAYVLNATVVPKTTLGFLKLYPCGETQPFTSNLNSADGRVKAVAALIGAGTNGGVCALPDKDTNFVLDISGYFVSAASNPNGLQFYPLAPCRAADTRVTGTPLRASIPQSFSIRPGSCNVPQAAQAYSLNFTAVPHAALGFLRAWPAGQAQPSVSTLNAPTGTTTANAAIVGAGSGGDISVVASDDSDLVIDINGYFAPPGSGPSNTNGFSFYALTPCRMLDTRHPPSAAFNGTLTLNVGNSGCGAASTATAYAVNATVVPPGSLGYLTLWADGAAQPPVSTLNANDGAVTSNMAIVPTTNGSIKAFVSNPADLVLDIFGYFAP